MNPSNIKNVTDQMKIREAYLANLQAQQANLDKTGNAQKIFATTGQAPIAPQDTRSMSERFTDIEKLKSNLRTMLKTLTDSPQVNIILAALTDEEIQGVSLLFPDIERNLKPRFLAGVPAPIFIEYVRRYLKDYSKNLGLSTGLQNTISGELQLTRDMLSQVIPSQAIMMELIRAISSAPPSTQQTQALAASQTLAAALPSPAVLSTAASTLNPVQVQNLNTLTATALQNVPTAAQVQSMTKDITDSLRSGKIKDSNNVLFQTLQFIKLQQDDLQNLRDVSDVIQQKEQAESKQEATAFEAPQNEIAQIARIVNSKEKMVRQAIGMEADKKGVNRPIYAPAAKTLVESGSVTDANMRLAEKIFELDRASPDELQYLKLLKPTVLGYYDYISKRDFKVTLPAAERSKLSALTTQELRQLLITDKDSGNIPFSSSMPSVTPSKSSSQAAVAKAFGATPVGAKSMANIADMADLDIASGSLQSINTFENLDDDEKVEYLFQLNKKGAFDSMAGVKALVTDMFKTIDSGNVVTPQEVIDIYKEVKTITGMGIKGMGIKGMGKYKGKKIVFGCGLNVKHEPKLFPSKVDFDMGIPMDKSYIPFGRYVINRHKLGDGKLMVKTINGGSVPKIPTLCISNELGRIIKKMVGGAMPTYKEMNSLNDDEQNTLYKVFKLAQIDKADLLPSPNKSKEEEQMNKFLILKGELQSGNNSTELIKDFKLMLMKMINGGKIPKGQGMDIVIDLMALGY